MIGALWSVLLTKYCSGDQIKTNEMGGIFSAYGRKERCSQGLVRRSEGKRPLERPVRRWEDNIKLYLEEVGWVLVWYGSEIRIGGSVLWTQWWTSWSHKIRRPSWLAEGLSASEGRCPFSWLCNSDVIFATWQLVTKSFRQCYAM